nr:probable G-protein coupled receptor Mth-like 3 [Drosophila takahashii]
MQLLLGSLSAIFVLLMQETNGEIPGCDFYDTVDISAGEKLTNGSYLFEGLLIPVCLWSEYDYKLLPGGSKESVGRHVRGCVCKLRTCIRFCCLENHKTLNGVCHGDMTMDEINKIDPYVNVTFSNGTVAKKHFKEDLILQYDLPKPCENEMHYIDHEMLFNDFTLFENGTFLLHFGNIFIEKREYCLQHVKTLGDDFRIMPHFCPLFVEESKIWETLAMIISLISILLTISVYYFLKKAQNVLDKCFICCMVCLFLYHLISFLNFWNLSTDLCSLAAYLSYYSFISLFLWLSIISLHLWNTFNGSNFLTNRFLPENQFLAYNTYVWGIAAILSGITFIADNVVENEDWNPGMGHGVCFIASWGYAIWLYLNGPILLLITLNVTMFIRTARILT